MNDLKPYDPICKECAESNGWSWPINHIATFSDLICAQCERLESCCEVSDWRKK